MTGEQRRLVNLFRRSGSVVACRLLLAVSIMTASTSGALAAEAAVDASSDREVLDLVYLAPRTPIFVTLHIRSNGGGFFNQREKYAHVLFQKLDQSGDGLLTGEELTTIPPAGHLVPVGIRNSAAATNNIRPADADNNGQITQQEFTNFVFRAAGAPFQVNPDIQTISSGSVVELFDRMDRNQDGRLTDAELANAPHILRLMDFNLDERIDADEIRLPTVFGNAPSMADSPAGQAAAALTLLEPINRQNVDESLVRQLVQMYDKLSPGPRRGRFAKDGRLSAKELGIPNDVLATYDGNHDQKLDQQELRDFLAHPHPVAEIFIEFNDDTEHAAIRSVVNNELPADAPIRFFNGQGEDVTVRLNDVDFQLAATPRKGVVLASSYRSFKGSDGDGNEYLDQNEFGNAIRRFDANQFQLVDTDGDGMIVDTEYDSFVQNQRELQKHVVSINLASQGKSLFPNIDANGDRQLDQQELASFRTRALAFDLNQDGEIDREELSGKLQMVVSRGNVNLQPTQSTTGTTIRQVRTTSRNPTSRKWFAKMDRNQDGEITRREFLGPLEVFDRLDADQNGRLTPDESEK